MTGKQKYPEVATGVATQGAKAKGGENLSAKDTTRPVTGQSAAIQRQRILEHLKYSTLTTLHARDQLDIMHPAIRVLRHIEGVIA